MDNKLYKLLEKINNDLSDFISNSLNGDNKVLVKCLKEDENGSFVEDKQHWDKMLVRSKNLQGLVDKLYVRLMTVNKVSDFMIARRMLNDENIVWDYEIFLDFEENCDLKDTRFSCIRMFNRTYETAMWYIDKAEDQLNEENGVGLKRLVPLNTNLTDPQRALLFDLLVKNGFIQDENKADFIWAFGGKEKPEKFILIKWIKHNSRTKGKNLSKASILNLLNILKVKESQIINRQLLNYLFAYPDGKSIKFSSSNYTGLSSKGYSSEYNKQLIEIVSMLG